MRTIQLTDCEARVLKELLEREQAELQPEIHHTDTTTVRDQLRDKTHTVTRLIERLNEAEPMHGHACACKGT